MQPYQRILLATDFSDLCHSTAQRAILLGEQFNAKIWAIHVVEALPGYASGYMGVAEIEKELMENAQKHMSELGTTFNIPQEQQLIFIGCPKIDVVKKADELNADLIIVGTHTKQGISRLLGSTASRILHHAHCDVLTIKEK